MPEPILLLEIQPARLSGPCRNILKQFLKEEYPDQYSNV
jgi:hypothetical protein